MANYTWGKTVSDYPWQNTLVQQRHFGPGFRGFQYPNIYDRGESNQSHRHRVVYSWIWSPLYGSKLAGMGEGGVHGLAVSAESEPCSPATF